ncbi:MAG: 30S ribosome-binding factor RbfA, partial [Actinomycetota bacterium]
TASSPCTTRRTDAMPEGGRPSRVSEEFREILAEEIPRLKDPRIGFVTVVGVRVTPDLRRARVFYTTMGDERARRATAAALRSARGHLRKVIGDQVRMKVLPDLEFEEDESVQTADRIEQLLQQVRPPDEESG